MTPIVLKTEQDLAKFAAKFAKDCDNTKKNLIIYLSGDLGSGKTTFSRYFIQAFGWTQKVKSPTYTLIEHYHLEDLDVYHLDLYRLAEPEELSFLGLDEIYNKTDVLSIILIEWPEKGGNLLLPPDITCKFDYVDGQDNARSIEIEYNRSH